jgi:hypothetical protein
LFEVPRRRSRLGGEGTLLFRTIVRHVVLALAIATPVGVVAANQGCGLNHDFCDVYCECELCNDRSEDACQVQIGAALDAADEYDCAEEAEAYIECLIDESDCEDDDNQFEVEPDCLENELDDLNDCIDDNSDLDVVMQGPSGPDGPAGGGAMSVFCECDCECQTCTLTGETKTCTGGMGGCESCDVVCVDACLADTMCGGPMTATGSCT